MTKQKEKGIYTPYSYFDIPGLNRTDIDVLSYNRSKWTSEGYFAKPEHAAAELRMSIKTFQKSVTKLTKMGLWKYKNEVVQPRKYAPKGGSKPLTRYPIPLIGENCQGSVKTSQ
jgi:hypothetical protein